MFFIRRTKLRKNLEAPVLMRITVNRERTDVSIQRTILPEQWNRDRGFAKPTTRYGKELNQCLNETRLQVYQCHQELLSKKLPVTAAALNTAFLHGTGEVEVHTLLDLYLEHNANLSRRNLERFLHDVYHKEDISIKDITHVFIKDYETYTEEAFLIFCS